MKSKFSILQCKHSLCTFHAHRLHEIGANQQLFGNVTAKLIFQKLLGLDLVK